MAILLFTLSAFGCSEPQRGTLTEEQEVFHATATNFMEGKSQSLTDATAHEWLLINMRSAARSNRTVGAVEDLRELEYSVTFMLEWADGTKRYEIVMAQPGGSSLKWIVDDFSWTFRNDAARKWLQDNEYLWMCDLTRHVGEDTKNELTRLTGELCRIALEKGKVE